MAVLLAALLILASLLALTAAPALAAEAEPCPNERLREESNLDPATERPYSTELPDCRAFEQVSPSYRNLSLVQGPARFTADGSRFFATGLGAYAGDSSGLSGNGDSYEFVRTPTDWQTIALYPPASEFNAFSSPILGPAEASTEGGDALLTGVSHGSPPKEVSIFLRHASGAFSKVGPLFVPASQAAGDEGDHGLGAVGVRYDGASSDLSHIFVDLAEEMWPVNPAGPRSQEQLYEYGGTNDPEPTLVGVSNEESLASAAAAQHKAHVNEAAELIGGCGTLLGAGTPNTQFHNAISASGETVIFTPERFGRFGCEFPSPPVFAVFARLGGEKTVAISEPSPSECGVGSVPTEEACRENTSQEANFRDAEFSGASRDGSKVFFTSPQQLTDEATQDPAPNDSPVFRGTCIGATRGPNGCNLYLYDFRRPAGNHLVDISAGDTSGLGPEVQGVGAVSEDGTHVYFIAKGVLTEEPNEFGATAEEGRENLYAWDAATEAPVFIAALSEEDRLQWGQSTGQPMQTTANGRFLLFTSHAPLTPDAAGGSNQVYRYDSVTKRLTRISIGEQGLAQNGNAGPAFVPTPHWNRAQSNADPHPAITEDGSVVVFESEGALVPAAPAGVNHVYEYESGHVYLVATTGQGESVEGINPSAQDIFLNSLLPLVPSDTNTADDIYDARVKGGFPAPAEPSVCQGESCQGAQSAPKSEQGPLTPSFSGNEEGPAHPQKPSRKHHPRHRHKKHNQRIHRRAIRHNRGGDE